jgi:trehalose-6-phosphate synthase
MPNAVQYKGRTVNIGTIPIGIDPEKFAEVISSPTCLFSPLGKVLFWIEY